MDENSFKPAVPHIPLWITIFSSHTGHISGGLNRAFNTVFIQHDAHKEWWKQRCGAIHTSHREGNRLSRASDVNILLQMSSYTEPAQLEGPHATEEGGGKVKSDKKGKPRG